MSVAEQRIPSPFEAVVGYTLRACLPARRWFGVLLPCLGALLFGWLAQFVHHDAVEGFADVAAHGLFGVVVPLTCLVIGDAVLGADVRAGTFQLTWLSPVHYATIATGRWLGGWLIALVTLVPALALAALIAGVPEAAAPIALAGAVGAGAYIALFLLLGVVTRRSAVWALAVVFLVERLLGTELTGIAQLSPLWQAQQTFAGLWDEGGQEIVRGGMPEGWSAVARLVLIGAVCLLVATWRLAHMRPFAGDD
jgi:ABC-type transport system involved in multi-copper enzyme maturation permease subunit